MNEQFNVKLDFNTTNIELITNCFNVLRTHIVEEKNVDNALNAVLQITPLLKILMHHPDVDLKFIDTEDFKNFHLSVKLLSSYSQPQEILNLIEGDTKNIALLRTRLKDLLKNSPYNSEYSLADAYLSFNDILQSSINNPSQWINIKESWNKHSDFFDIEKITHNNFNSKFKSAKLPKNIYHIYFKIIKLCQEKIAETLLFNFLHYPENSEKLSSFAPEFFQFLDWLERPEKISRDLACLLEQKHFDNLTYASKIKGFENFILNIFIQTQKSDENDSTLDPFSDSPTSEYKCINLAVLKSFNSKKINIDMILKDNSLGLPHHLRDYLYQKIDLLEKTDFKHSAIEFHELDKLLIVYEKQKMESVYLPKKTISKTHKI